MSGPDLLSRLFAAAPLEALLSATGAELVECPIEDDEFLGGVVERKDGRVFLAMPPGRPTVERETVARDLLARIVGVERWAA